MNKIRLLTLSAIFSAFAALPTAHAITVSPMQVEMVSVGSRSHAQVSVVNNSDHPLPVEAVIHKLSLDEAGKQQTVRAGEEFLIMPPQAMIPPGATQNFRVQWLGDPMMQRSESYLLYLNQIPVKLPKNQTGVQIVMSMGVMVNVAPAQGAPQMRVVATGVTTDKAGKRRPTITVENVSNTHALLPQATIRLAAGNWGSTLTPLDMSDGIGIGLVQPGKRRKFMLPVELPASISKVSATVEMPPGRR